MKVAIAEHIKIDLKKKKNGGKHVRLGKEHFGRIEVTK